MDDEIKLIVKYYTTPDKHIGLTLAIKKMIKHAKNKET